MSLKRGHKEKIARRGMKKETKKKTTDLIFLPHFDDVHMLISCWFLSSLPSLFSSFSYLFYSSFTPFVTRHDDHREQWKIKWLGLLFVTLISIIIIMTDNKMNVFISLHIFLYFTFFNQEKWYFWNVLLM